DRFSGGLTSAIYADATDKFAPAIPANTRDASNSHNAFSPVNVDAYPKPAYATADPKLLTSNTGLRPIRSESRPHHDANINCISENDPAIAPFIHPLAPNSLL